MQIETGKYTGDGVDGRSISVSFTPDFVFISTDAAQQSVCRFGIAGDYAFEMASNVVPTSNLIQTLTTNAFTIGDDARVNGNGSTYYWMAIRDDGTADIDIGSYTGNGVDDRDITGVGFQPDFVLIKRGTDTTGNLWWKTKSLTGDNAGTFKGSTSFYADLIQGFVSDGFTVGTNNAVNQNGATYYYICLKEVSGMTKFGSYTGDGTDNRNITGIGFSPDCLWIKSQATIPQGCSKTDEADTDGEESQWMDGTAELTNAIQSLDSDGFQVGSRDHVNENGITIHYMAFNEGQSSAGSASISPSISPTPSASESASVSPSISPTPSSSVSPSPSASVSPSPSPSASSTPSPSISPSASISPSVSPTPSAGSASISPSISPSVSPSVSPSASPSPSLPVDAHYYYGHISVSPRTRTPSQLESDLTAFAYDDYSDVASDDSSYVSNCADSTEYEVFMFENDNASEIAIYRRFKGYFTRAPKNSTVHMDAWNDTTSSWDNDVDSNTTADAYQEIELQWSKTSGYADYWDDVGGEYRTYIIIWQQAV